MNSNEIKALDNDNTTIIEQIYEDGWIKWEPENICGARFPAKSRNAAIKVAQENESNLIAEKTPEGFKLVMSALNRNYLKGLQFGVITAQTALEDFASDPFSEKLYNANCRITSCITKDCEELADIKSIPDKLCDLLSMINRYYPSGRIRSEEVYSTKEIKSLSPVYGIITNTGKDDDKYHGVINTAEKNGKSPLNPHTAATIDSVIERMAEQGCALVVEKIKANQYKIVYSDLQKNFLRGQIAVGIALEKAREYSNMSDKKLESKVNDDLRKIIRKAQKEINLPSLKANDTVLQTLNFNIPWNYTAINHPVARER